MLHRYTNLAKYSERISALKNALPKNSEVHKFISD